MASWLIVFVSLPLTMVAVASLLQPLDLKVMAHVALFEWMKKKSKGVDLLLSGWAISLNLSCICI